MLNRLYREYGALVAFYMVYTLEAHASDLWQDPQNLRDQILIKNPLTRKDRETVAGVCVRDLGLEIPALVDGIDNATEAAYTAWPERIYIIDRQGLIAFKTEPGPYGFDPSQAENALRAVLPPPASLSSKADGRQ